LLQHDLIAAHRVHASPAATIALHNGMGDDAPAVRRQVSFGTLDGFLVNGE